MKNSSKFDCPCWIQTDLSNEAAYEIHIFLSRLAEEFLDRHYDQIEQHEQAIDFWKDNNTSERQLSFEDDLPF